MSSAWRQQAASNSPAAIIASARQDSAQMLFNFQDHYFTDVRVYTACSLSVRNIAIITVSSSSKDMSTATMVAANVTSNATAAVACAVANSSKSFWSTVARPGF